MSLKKWQINPNFGAIVSGHAKMLRCRAAQVYYAPWAQCLAAFFTQASWLVLLLLMWVAVRWGWEWFRQTNKKSSESFAAEGRKEVVLK